MSSVDDRIVNMQWQNTQFKTGASESAKSLADVEGALTKLGKNGGLEGMDKAVGGISAKFGALQVAGVAALGTIVAKATSVGLSMLKSFTLDPITQGFSEYTTNLNSIQTVVANTGASVDEVNGYMAKLNEYSDQTIYNFSEMAKNIGTFTAAGVNLETATASIQGIANLAALSGSNSQQASTAMYQLSQAIASGRVSLMDWNSVVNAGMGGKVFQNALAQTSVAMGELSADAVEVGDKVTIMGGSFRDAIGGGDSFLTSESLVNTLAALDGRFSRVALAANGYNTVMEQNEQILKARNELEKQGVKYSDEQFDSLVATADKAYEAATAVKSFPQLLQVVKESIGSIFANSFSLILGDFEQSKDLWGKVGKSVLGTIGSMGAAWTGLLRDFVDTGGRTKVLSGLGRIFRNLGKVMGALKGAFSDIFPPAGEKALTNIAKAFNQFTRNFVLSKDTVANLRSVFGGFFAVLHIGFSIIKALLGVVGSFFGVLLSGSDEAGGGILTLAAGLGEALIALDKFLTGSGGLTERLKELGTLAGEFVKPFVDGLGLIANTIASLVQGADISTIGEQFKELSVYFQDFSNFSGPIEKGIATVKDAFAQAAPYINKVGTALQYAQDKLSEFLDSGSFVANVLSTIISAAGNVAEQAASLGTNIVAGIVSGVTGAGFGEVQAAIVGLAQNIIDWFKGALGIASPAAEMVQPGVDVVRGIALGIVSAVSVVGDAMAKVASKIKDGFNQLFGDFDAIDFATLMNQIISGGLLLTLTSFLGESKGPFSQIKESFVGFFDNLGDTLKTFQQGIKAKALLDIALAVGVLVAAIVVLSLLDPKQIAISLGAIATMLGLLTGTLTLLSKFTKGGLDLPFLALSMTLIAAALIQMSIAVAAFGNMDMGTLAKGFGAIALGLGLMVAAAFGFSKIQGSIEGMAGSILVISFALTILAAAVAAFGNMDLGTLAKGFGSIAIGLGLMVGAMLLLDKMKSSPEGLAGSILVMAGALLVLSAAVAAFGNMDIATLAKGFGAIAVGLILMVGSLLILSAAGPMVLQGAAGMVLMAGALVLMAQAIQTLGGMSVGELAKGLGALAVGLVILLAAGAAAMFVAPGLIALGIAIGLIGAGVFLAGTGMLFLAAGITALVAVGVAGIALFAIAFQTFLGLLPTFAIQIAAAFVSFIETIAKAAPRVRAAMSTIFSEMLGVVTDAIPQLGNLMSTLVTTAIGVLRKSIPQWIQLGITVISKFLQAVAAEVPKIAESALAMVEDFLTAVDNHIDPIIAKGTEIIIKFIRGMGKAASEIAEAAGQTIEDFLSALDATIQSHSKRIGELGASIATHLITGLASGLVSGMQSAVNDAISKLDIPSPSQIIKNATGIGQRKSKGSGLIGADGVVDAAFVLANSLRYDGATQPIKAAAGSASQAAREAKKAELYADSQQKAADDAQDKADKLRAKADKKKATEADRKKANKAKKAADRAQKAANKAARDAESKGRKSESANSELDRQIALEEADSKGKGDIFADKAQDLAAQANDLLAKSQAEAAEAEKYKKSNAKLYKKILAQSEADAAQARQLAAEANAASQSALGFYAAARAEAQAAVTQRVQDLRGAIAQDIQDRLDAAAYEAADDQGKIKILEARAAANEKKRDDARLQAAQFLAEAERLNAAGDTDAANALLDKAEAQAQLAASAADAAEQDRSSIKDLLDQISGGSVGGSGSSITPSRSVLEDAASLVDRYTKSLNEASQLALASQQQPVNYTQNISSPVALTPQEIYRQSRNLISAREGKIGVSP